MFLIFIAVVVLVYLFSVKEGIDHNAENQEKYSFFQTLQDAYDEYNRILSLNI